MSECKYKRPDGTCERLSEPAGVQEYCVEGSCPDETTQKGDHIKREDAVVYAISLVDRFYEGTVALRDIRKEAKQQVINEMNSTDIIPAADVVEVVKCRECKYWASTLTDAERDELAADPDGDGVCDYWECDGLGPNDYCSCAVSRGDDNATRSD